MVTPLIKTGLLLLFLLFTRYTLYAATLPATIAGTMSDSNNDNIGDEAVASPSLLISAGLQSSGAVGQNGTVRWQIEWDISTLSSEEIDNAIIVIKTHKGSIDSLNTFIFHGLADQDGEITKADFTTPVDALDIVMPVVDGISNFEFDATELLRSDLAKGYQFFSIQGRVDETLSIRGRGLQIYSNEAILLINQQITQIAIQNEQIATLNTDFTLTANAENCEVDPNGWVWTQDPYNLFTDEMDGEIIADASTDNLTLNWSDPGNKMIRVKNSACGDNFIAETTVVVSGQHCDISVENQLTEPGITINGIIRGTLDNQPLADVCIDLGITNTKTAGDGTFSLTVPINIGKIYFTLSKPGYIERNTTLIIEDLDIAFQADLIDLNNDFFDLLAYKKVLYDRQLVAPYGLERLTEQFGFYIDISPDAMTGETFSQQQIEHITALIPDLVTTMTNGFIENPVITIGVNPPQNNVITFSLKSTIYTEGAAGYNQVFLKSPEVALNDYVVNHELAHTLGYAHTNGVPSLMASYSIFYTSLDGEIISMGEPTGYDVNFSKILYSRNHGSTIAHPADITIEFDASLQDYSTNNSVSDVNKLLNWSEIQFPQLFAPKGVETQSIELIDHSLAGSWQYRYYSETDTYAGVRDGNGVYVLGGGIWQNITYVGTLQDFLNQIND